SLIDEYPDWKFIIAPHEVNEKRLKELKDLFPGSVNYSEIKNNELQETDPADHRILIIDGIGILSSVYQYGTIAYIGGGFGVGIHNTLEAAAFGMPVIFGPNYTKFQEAVGLIDEGAAFSVKNPEELSLCMSKLQEPGYLQECSLKAKDYVLGNTGASRIFLDHLSGKGIL
ncbi:MAG: 3-deoxy-D-manno-octulosonic acid transferase, partial [Pedobacter sp.]